MHELAIYTGRPAFAEKLHVGRPNIGDREHFFRRVSEILDRRWLSNGGQCVQELEARICSLLGVAHCISVCNATVGLEIAVRALGLTGEVIVPSFTFVATAHALQWLGVRPVFCDVDRRTHNLDPACVDALITPETSAILAVHVWGRSCDVDALSEIAARHRLRLLFDAAHAFACSRGEKMIGGFGDAEVFSFHATKFFNSFEGGAITTNDPELAHRVRLMQNFGFSGIDNVIELGTNGKMSEVAGAMALTSLDSISEFIEVNRRNREHYRRCLAGIPGITLVEFPEADLNNFQYVVVEVDASEAGISRDHFAQVLWAENVMAKRYFSPGVHRMEPYRTLYPDAGAVLPATEALVQRVLLLPTGTAVDQSEIEMIGRILTQAARNAKQVRAVLERGAGLV